MVWNSLTLVALAVAIPGSAIGQAGPVTLELGDDPALADGQVAIVEAAAGPEGVRYLLPKLSIRQPVGVTLLSRESNPSLEITLHSPSWRDTARSAALDGEALRTLRFRTQGDVGITVRSRDARRQRFDLVAWVGSKVDPPLEPAVVTPEEFRKYAAASPDLYPASVRPAAIGGTSPVLIVIAVALCGILALLGFLVVKQVRS